MYRAFAYVGGNWNNDLNCGPFYANLYNSATNSNTKPSPTIWAKISVWS